VARATVGFFPVVAYGDLAEKLGVLLNETKVTVTAKLVMHRWKTQEGKPRERMELQLTSLNVVEKPNRLVA